MKRSSKKNKCANPLFERWIEEWKDEAAARDSPIQHAFGKALNSLKKFPISLATGKDCNVLEHFGPKICSMLDKKLDQYRKAHNLPANSSQISCYDDEIKVKRKKKSQPPDDSLPSTSGLNDFNSANIFSNSNEEKRPKNQELSGQGAEKKNNTRKTTNRPYVPKVGSGAYALLITLCKNTKMDSNQPDFMLKKDLISESKYYCDSPMKQTAIEHYSGWSSMSTLIEKHLVTKKSSPAKYRLTDAGYALALQLMEAPSTQGDNDENLYNDDQSGSKNDKNPRSISSQSSCETNPSSNNFPSLSQHSRNISGTNNGIKSSNEYSSYKPDTDFAFPEIHDDILKSPKKKSVDGILNSNSSIESKQSSKSLPMSYQNNDDIIVLDDEDDVFENPKIESNNINSLDNFENIESDQEFQEFCKENVEPLTPVKKKTNVLYSNLLNPLCESDSPVHSETLNKKTQYLSPLPSTSTQTYKRNIDFDKLEIDDVDSNVVNKPECSTATKKTTVPDKTRKLITSTSNAANCKKTSVDTPTETFYLLPNNFDIILLVDTQETSGGKTRPKDDATISELSALQTVFEIRSLKIGDFAWIARCRFTNKELVLPFIVERKRIDDLSSSIKDGRYHEQKFRLRQSGIKNVIYLIENYGTTYHGCIPITSLFQAAVNSLVQDNFQVKFTQDHKDSMSYLATITKMLMKIYESKELVSCRKKDILELANMDYPNDAVPLMEFSEFNKSATKTKNFKVKEMLIRQLLQLKGLSVNKAVAITDFYPTPKLLYQALKDSDEKLLANIEAGSSKSKIGPAISKTIWQFYTQRNFA